MLPLMTNVAERLVAMMRFARACGNDSMSGAMKAVIATHVMWNDHLGRSEIRIARHVSG